MEDDESYVGISFMAMDVCTNFMIESCDIEYFIEYPDLIKKEITRQRTNPLEREGGLKNLSQALKWKEPIDGEFIVVLDYHSYRDYWGEWDETVDVIGILGVDCIIKKNK